MSSKVFIVLATFNGGRFLSAQLESLFAQKESRWSLLIGDDGSTDQTLSIVQNYQQKYSRIHISDRKRAFSGTALSNFSSLLCDAYERGAEYVFCCDQDDVWDTNKVQLMLAQIRQLEGENKAPSLLHHDLMVVDEFLEPNEDSFVNMMQLNPSDQRNPQRLITRNEVTGCAMLCNRALLKIALPISNQAVMHDWWLAMCAAYFGRLAFMPDKLVKYRQHGANTIGAKSFWHGLNPFENWVAGWKRGDEEFISTVKQASAFKDAMVDKLGRESEAYSTLKTYAGLQAATRWQRLRVLRDFGLWRSHWLLNVVLVMRMLLLPRTPE